MKDFDVLLSLRFDFLKPKTMNRSIVLGSRKVMITVLNLCVVPSSVSIGEPALIAVGFLPSSSDITKI